MLNVGDDATARSAAWEMPTPSFVDEPPGEGILLKSDAIDDTHRYVRNIALWLAGRDP